LVSRIRQNAAAHLVLGRSLIFENHRDASKFTGSTLSWLWIGS
jgi:hypothetical protein